jgi:hypothetical protein
MHTSSAEAGGYSASEADDVRIVTEVVFEPAFTKMLTMVVFIIFGTLAASFIAISLRTSSIPPFMVGVLIGAASLVVICAVLIGALVRRKTVIRRLRGALAASACSPIESRIRDVLPLLRFLYPHKVVQAAVAALNAEGQTGLIIRVAPAGQARRIEPIDVTFEPRFFDEFSDVGSSGASSGRSALGGGEEKEGTRVPRGIRRNVLMKGGWILFGLLFINWLFVVGDALTKHTVTVHLVTWSVILVLFLFIPVRGGWLTAAQWLAVPGGLLVRKSSWRERRWRVHVFDRRASVLMMYRLFRQQWALAVADKDACETTVGTREELEAALAAWLCPLPPPKPEHLSDWE